MLANYASLLSTIVGRDITKELNALQSSRVAIGAALTTEQQVFLSTRMLNAPAFLYSDAGKKAIQQFVNSWIVSEFPQMPKPAPAVEETPQPLSTE